MIHLLDMCMTTSATAEAICNANTNTNYRMKITLGLGVRHLEWTTLLLILAHVIPLIKIKNPSHILHNTARKASEMFLDGMNFDAEELVIDLYYWFDKSKNELQSFCTF